MRTPLFALMALAIAAPATALDDPDQLIKALYALDQIPIRHREIDRFFARDLAAAIKKDIAPKDEVGQTNDGDYRYDAQEFQITDLAFAKATNRTGGTVTATFRNFGEPGEVVYAMCLARSGWKIANVTSKGWDMRQVLDLPSLPVKC